jgi:hypothetical protein
MVESAKKQEDKELTLKKLRKISAIHPPVTDRGFSGRLV